MDITNKSYWYNYVTDEFECRETPTDFTAYVPQLPAAQNLYRLYVDDMGMSPLDAAGKVLEAYLGIEKG